jgi:hypothetical protein
MRGQARQVGFVRQVRRQTRRRTSLELHRLLSGAGRTWVKEVWDAADRTSAQLPLLSPLAGEVGRHLASSYALAERLEGDEVQDALDAAIRAGYGTRSVVAGPTEQPSLDASRFGLEGTFPPGSVPSDSAEVEELAEAVRGIALDRFEQVMSLPEEVWGGLVAVAAMRLQRRLTTGDLTWRELTRARIEAMLRYGYVLACLDEAVARTKR